MKDRIPTKPGRVKLVPSPDDDDLFILTRSDEPTQEGTPLNKASLLSDSTAADFELTGDDATVNNALALVSGNYSRIRTGTAAPDADTVAKRGDIYIMDSGAERHAYLCDAVGAREIDLGADWERGGITGSGVSASADYRIRSQVVDIPGGTVLSIASGFRFAMYRFDEAGVYVSAVGWRTAPYTVTADMRFRIMIGRVTENTAETADVAEFSSALSAVRSGAHWTALAAAREVRKTVILTSSTFWQVPADLRGTVTVQCFGGGAGGTSYAGTGGNYGAGGGGGHMATWTGTLDAKKYEINVGAGGLANSNGGATSFGSLCTAAGGTGKNGGSGGGGGDGNAADKVGGSGSYGGGGGAYNGAGGSGGTYGGGGGGGTGKSGGSGRSGTYAGGAGSGSYGGGGGGWSAVGKAASSSTGGAGGAGQNTTGFGLDFEGTGAAGTVSGGGGGYGGPGGAGLKTGTLSTGGGGGGYGAKGGAAGASSGGGGGGYGGPGGDGYANCGGGGGGYGLSGAGGSRASGSSNGGIAAGGAGGGAGNYSGHGGNGCVVIYYTGIEVV